jgi:hypothetical protein
MAAMLRRAAIPVPLVLAGALLAGCGAPGHRAAEEHGPWLALQTPATAAAWSVVSFGGEGEVEFLEDGVRLGFGVALTGVRWDADGLPDGAALPRDGYELELRATRLGGNDFFCGLSFPVGDGALTLVLGGWGGSLVGLSCLDGADASSNETTCFRRFESGREYAVRVRVADGRVRAWLDGERVVDAVVAGRRCELRAEIVPGGPFGLAAFQTAAELRGLRLRRLRS